MVRSGFQMVNRTLPKPINSYIYMFFSAFVGKLFESIVKLWEYYSSILDSKCFPLLIFWIKIYSFDRAIIQINFADRDISQTLSVCLLWYSNNFCRYPSLISKYYKYYYNHNWLTRHWVFGQFGHDNISSQIG